MTKKPQKLVKGWNVLHQTLSKTQSEGLGHLVATHRAERLHLALGGAREAAFDWTLADDRIAWDGAQELLALHHDPLRLKLGAVFRGWMSEAGRAKLREIVDNPVPENS